MAEIVKFTYQLTLVTHGGHIEKKPIATISEIVFREPKYQVSMPKYQNQSGHNLGSVNQTGNSIPIQPLMEIDVTYFFETFRDSYPI